MAFASLFTQTTATGVIPLPKGERLPVPKPIGHLKPPPYLPASMYDSISCFKWANPGDMVDAHWKKVLTIAHNFCNGLDENSRKMPRPVREVGRDWDFYGDRTSLGGDYHEPHEAYHAGVKEQAVAYDTMCEPEKETLDLLRPKGLDLEDYAEAMVDSVTAHKPKSPKIDTRVCVSLLYNAWAMCKDNKASPFLISFPHLPGPPIHLPVSERSAPRVDLKLRTIPWSGVVLSCL